MAVTTVTLSEKANINYEGEWSETASYVTNNVVLRLGALYVSEASTITQTNAANESIQVDNVNFPPETNSSVWTRMSTYFSDDEIAVSVPVINNDSTIAIPAGSIVSRAGDSDSLVHHSQIPLDRIFHPVGLVISEIAGGSSGEMIREGIVTLTLDSVIDPASDDGNIWLVDNALTLLTANGAQWVGRTLSRVEGSTYVCWFNIIGRDLLKLLNTEGYLLSKDQSRTVSVSNAAALTNTNTITYDSRESASRIYFNIRLYYSCSEQTTVTTTYTFSDANVTEANTFEELTDGTSGFIEFNRAINNAAANQTYTFTILLTLGAGTFTSSSIRYDYSIKEFRVAS